MGKEAEKFDPYAYVGIDPGRDGGDMTATAIRMRDGYAQTRLDALNDRLQRDMMDARSLVARQMMENVAMAAPSSSLQGKLDAILEARCAEAGQAPLAQDSASGAGMNPKDIEKAARSVDAAEQSQWGVSVPAMMREQLEACEKMKYAMAGERGLKKFLISTPTPGPQLFEQWRAEAQDLAARKEPVLGRRNKEDPFGVRGGLSMREWDALPDREKVAFFTRDRLSPAEAKRRRVLLVA